MVKDTFPKKPSRAPIPSLDRHPRTIKRTFTMKSLLDSSIGRKVIPVRKKKTPIEYLNMASIAIEQINVQYEHVCPAKTSESSIGFELKLIDLSLTGRRLDSEDTPRKHTIQEGSKVLSIEFDFSLASAYADILDTIGKARTVEIDKISNRLKYSRYVGGEEDPNTNSLTGHLDISTPDFIINYHHFESYMSLISAFIVKKDSIFKDRPLSELPADPASSIVPARKQQICNIPKLHLTFSILRPTFRVAGVHNSLGNSDLNLTFGFQDILFDINGDYIELTPAKPERTLSRRLNKDRVAPSFSLVYNMVASLKARNMRLYTLESDLLVNHSWEISFAASALGTVASSTTDTILEKESFQMDISWLIDGLEIRLCDKNSFAILFQILQDVNNSFKDSGEDYLRDHPQISVHSPSSSPLGGTKVLTIPETLQFHVSLSSVSIKIAGVDSFVDPLVSRGFDIESSSIVFDYRGVRADVDPSACYNERVRLSLSSQDSMSDTLSDDGAQARAFLRGFKLTPILALWDVKLLEKTKPLINIPEIEAQCTISPDYEKNGCGFVTKLNLKIEKISVVYSLFYSYCCLVGAMNMAQLFPVLPRKSDAPTSSSSNSGIFKIDANLSIGDINIWVELPEDIKLFARVGAFDYKFVSPADHVCKIKRIQAFGTSPSEKEKWDELVSIHNSEILIFDSVAGIELQSEAVHVRVPYNYIFADVFDGIANSIKSIKVLHQRLLLRQEDISLEPDEEGPKYLPTLLFKVDILTFRMEDDPFEGRLGLNWKIGRIEQHARLARDTAFEAKVEAIRVHEQENPLSISDDARSLGSTKEESLDTHSNPSMTSSKLPSSRANIDIDTARIALDEYNSRNWIRRIKSANARFHQMTVGNQDKNLPISITDTSDLPPALLKVTVEKVLFTVSSPSFQVSELQKFMHDIGKGLPMDTKFTLLIPMHLNCKMKGACWVQIRDYPTPLAYIPRMESSQGKKLYSSIDGDLVIGEELRGIEAIRKVSVNIVPVKCDGIGGLYSIIIPRTCSPVKLYSDLHININAAKPTVFSWGISMQPAVQDVVRVLESLTKPSPDPSELLGFWDKLRLMMHVRIMMEFKGGGDVRFLTKGSRDPYFVTGLGSGFVLCFRNGVKIKLGYSNDAGEFLQVDSDDFISAIPDLAEIVSNSFLKVQQSQKDSFRTSDTMETKNSDSPNIGLLKVLMKIGGGVRYGMGCQFHRSCQNSWGICQKCDNQGKCRLKDFIPHYKIITRMPEYAIAPPGQVYDSFRGFRSDMVHLSFSVICPLNWDDPDGTSAYSNGKQSTSSYNSIQVTPKSIQHAFAWISLFDKAMTLPIRQGALFPTQERPPQKLTKFLHTLKYKICLAPLFLGLFYKDDTLDDWTDGRTQIVGLKGKIERFTIDIHQKVQEKFVQIDQGKVKVREMILHEAEMDLKDLDVRGIAVRYIEEPVDQFGNKDHESTNDSIHEDQLGKDEDFVLINPEDEEWIDKDDYVELDSLLSNVKPKVRVLSFLRSPQLMYYKHAPAKDTDEEKKMDQEAHVCVMGQGRDTCEIQTDLLTKRLNEIAQEILRLKGVEEKFVSDAKNQEFKDELQAIRRAMRILSRKQSLIQDHIERLQQGIISDQKDSNQPKFFDDEDYDFPDDHSSIDFEEDDVGFNSPLWADSLGLFSHRFVIHNAQLLWNNSLRNLIYKYWDLIEQQQGLAYYMSMNAVKYIRDLQKNRENTISTMAGNHSDSNGGSDFDSSGFDVDMAAELLRKLVGEENANFIAKDEVTATAEDSVQNEDDDMRRRKSSHQLDDLPDGYSLWKNYIVQLINPQISFQSDKNPLASIIMSSERAQLKCVSILEDRLKGDDANQVVKTRTIFGLDNTQFFLTWKKDFQHDYSKLLTANNFGAKGTENWPAWVPVEALFNYDKKSSFPFQRIVKRTSATMLYDKFNHLRILGSDLNRETTGPKWSDSSDDKVDKRIDLVHINFPRFKFSATSAQFCVFSDVVSDLPVYREPTKTERVERLETILLAADLDDLSGAAEMVASLQQKIRQLELQMTNMAENGTKELWTIKAELLHSQEELYLLIEAITVTQNKKEKAESNVALKVVVTADEVVWVMQHDNRKPFCEWGLSNAHFVRMTQEDHSNRNILEIDRLHAVNKMPSPVFIELIYPYITDRRPVDFSRHKMLRVYWSEMEPVGGIAVVEHFEVNMFPLKFQMQYEVGKQIVQYIFPEKRNEKAINTNVAEKSSNNSLDQATTPENNEHLNIPEEGASSLHSPSGSRRNSVGSSDGVKFSKALLIPELTDTGDTSLTSEEVILSSTHSIKKSHTGFGDINNTQQSNELMLMRTRASKNKTFIYIKITGVTYNFSYQGEKEKNFLDLYDFVFRLPTLEYRNRTWSWLDLLEHLKRDIIKVILSHTGALVREKLLQSRRGRPTAATNTITSASPSDGGALALDAISVESNSETDLLATPKITFDTPISDDDNQEQLSDRMSTKTNDSQETKGRKKGLLGFKSKKREKTELIAKANIYARPDGTSSSSSINTIVASSSNSTVLEEEKETKGKLLFGKLYQ